MEEENPGMQSLIQSKNQNKSQQQPNNFQSNNNEKMNSEEAELLIKTQKQTNNKKQQKMKKKKTKQFITDFQDFLPEALILANKTHVKFHIRIGDKYQAVVPMEVRYKSIYNPMNQLKIWSGSTKPNHNLTDNVLQSFRELLGQNRTNQEIIFLKTKMNMKSWKEVIDYATKNKAELRKIYYQTVRKSL